MLGKWYRKLLGQCWNFQMTKCDRMSQKKFPRCVHFLKFRSTSIKYQVFWLTTKNWFLYFWTCHFLFFNTVIYHLSHGEKFQVRYGFMMSFDDTSKNEHFQAYHSNSFFLLPCMGIFFFTVGSCSFGVICCELFIFRGSDEFFLARERQFPIYLRKESTLFRSISCSISWAHTFATIPLLPYHCCDCDHPFQMIWVTKMP